MKNHFPDRNHRVCKTLSPEDHGTHQAQKADEASKEQLEEHMIDLTPKPTGKVSEVSLSGNLIPYQSGQPVLLSVTGSPHFYLPCFSTTEKLEAVMKRIGLAFDSIKQIEDGPTFLQSIQPLNGVEVRLALDFYYTLEGKVRYSEVHPEGSFSMGVKGS